MYFCESLRSPLNAFTQIKALESGVHSTMEEERTTLRRGLDLRIPLSALLLRSMRASSKVLVNRVFIVLVGEAMDDAVTSRQEQKRIM